MAAGNKTFETCQKEASITGDILADLADNAFRAIALSRFEKEIPRLQIQIEGLDVLATSILVIFLGRFLTTRVAALQRYNIPPAVTGGLLFSILVALVYVFWDAQITFDLALRDLLLLFFFSTIGLSAKLRLLVEGGKTIAILVVVAAGMLVLQDVAGVGLALLFGGHPGYGLFAGSVSFAGGHGTAIAWGAEASAAGLQGAAEFGIAAATIGLVAGGIIGGPIGGWLIDKYSLEPADGADTKGALKASATDPRPVTIWSVLATLLMLSVCIEAGDLVNRFLAIKGLKLPGFLTAMVVGIIISNASDLLGRELHKPTISATGELSLQLFLSMSLMSMQLWILANAATAILAAVMLQAELAGGRDGGLVSLPGHKRAQAARIPDRHGRGDHHLQRLGSARQGATQAHHLGHRRAQLAAVPQHESHEHAAVDTRQCRHRDSGCGHAAGAVDHPGGDIRRVPFHRKAL